MTISKRSEVAVPHFRLQSISTSWFYSWRTWI